MLWQAISYALVALMEYMKKFAPGIREFNLVIILILWGISGCGERVTVEDLQVFAPVENYPDDVFLDTVATKQALVIVAHDDDDCGMAGTIAKLSQSGWKIQQVSLQRHLIPDMDKNPADIICEGNELLLDDGHYRIGLDTMKTPYLPISNEAFEEQFLYDKVSDALREKVAEFNPSVIFTLDDVKGGYGHPEHIFISRLVKDLFMSGDLGAQRIYQSVYTDHMEIEIVDKWLAERMQKWGYPHASTIANELYGIDGMPEPTTQVRIADVASTKMKYLRAYDEDVRKNLRKFIPYYEEFDAETYFGIFDREFFRVVEIR